MARSNEPIWWSLFAAGGAVAATFMPVTMLLTGLAIPAGLITAEGLQRVVQYPLAQLYLLLLISLPLFHWAHRFRYTAMDLGLKGLGAALPIMCYGAAILGTVVALVRVLGF